MARSPYRIYLEMGGRSSRKSCRRLEFSVHSCWSAIVCHRARISCWSSQNFRLCSNRRWWMAHFPVPASRTFEFHANRRRLRIELHSDPMRTTVCPWMWPSIHRVAIVCPTSEPSYPCQRIEIDDWFDAHTSKSRSPCAPHNTCHNFSSRCSAVECCDLVSSNWPKYSRSRRQQNRRHRNHIYAKESHSSVCHDCNRTHRGHDGSKRTPLFGRLVRWPSNWCVCHCWVWNPENVPSAELFSPIRPSMRPSLLIFAQQNKCSRFGQYLSRAHAAHTVNRLALWAKFNRKLDEMNSAAVKKRLNYADDWTERNCFVSINFDVSSSVEQHRM